MMRSIYAMKEDLGGTLDNFVFQEIKQSLEQHPEDVAEIEKKKIFELIIEVTDGGTNGEGIASMKEALASIDELGEGKIYSPGNPDRRNKLPKKRLSSRYLG